MRHGEDFEALRRSKRLINEGAHPKFNRNGVLTVTWPYEAL
jgi:hypothetical protein